MWDPYLEKKQSIEIVSECLQMLQILLFSKDFKADTTNMFKELRKLCIKKWKYDNKELTEIFNKDVEIIKKWKKQIENLELKIIIK